MTEENILDAIRKALMDTEDLSQKFEKKPPASAFMNRNRQAIFSYLCTRPCSAMVKISKGMKMSTPTVKWHLKQLVENKFVSTARVGSRVVFYPTELVMPAHLEMLACLNEPLLRHITAEIIRKPGVSQKELCGIVGLKHQTLIYNTSRLEKSGLVCHMRDGKFTRYYPSDKLSKLRESSIRQIHQFRKNLVKMLKKDGVSPRIARTTYGELHVEVTRGGERAMLVLHTDPFVTVLT
jgi:predicted transcriptional regulator